MKKINSYYLEEDIIQEIKRIAKIKNCSEGQVVQNCIIDSLSRGGPLAHENSEHQIKSIRLKIQEEQFKRSLKNMHSKSIAEVGGRIDE